MALMVETQQVYENGNIDSAMTQLIAAEGLVSTCAAEA
jgi:hypothetical protein